MCNNLPNPLLIYIVDEIMKLNKNMNNSFDKVLIKNVIYILLNNKFSL